MTFYEAALEVLRKSGRALHYKKIIEVAIRDDLLAHVGRSPLAMMEQRLELESQKGDQAWIFQTRPGVYSLKEDIVEQLNDAAGKREEKNKTKPKVKRKKRRPVEADLDKPETDSKSSKKIKGNFESVADAAYEVLRQNQSKPMDIDELANIIFGQKLVRFHTHEQDLSTETALLLDNLSKEKDNDRSRFEQERDGAWGLSDWKIDSLSLKNLSQVDKLINEIKREATKEFGHEITKLSADVFEMLIMHLLGEMHFTNVKVAKRSTVGEVVLSGDWRRGFSPVRTCVLLHNADMTIEKKHLKNFKKSLNHYSAQEGVVIHIGRIGKDVSKEAKTLNLTFIERKKLVDLLFEYGIGVRSHHVKIDMVDKDMLKALS